MKENWRYIGERGRYFTLTEAGWCVWILAISISDSRGETCGQGSIVSWGLVFFVLVTCLNLSEMFSLISSSWDIDRGWPEFLSSGGFNRIHDGRWKTADGPPLKRGASISISA